MVIECCGYDQILDCLLKIHIKYSTAEKLAPVYFERYGNGRVCFQVDDNMNFEGYCRREYFEEHGHIVYSYEEVFGTPEEFGQMTLEEVLYV